MESVYVLTLVDSRANLETVGGKGASLARLAINELPVPDGFHVTTAAYKRFVAENNLDPGIEAALKTVDLNQPVTFEAASRTIQGLFTRATIPADVAGEVAQAYGHLPGDRPAVAVRSSATAEDLPDLSFAGQQETFLNIAGASEVVEAVRRCWASLWTPRAISYRQQNNIDHKAVSLAVVVQLLVEADAAGILFTANPLNGRRDQALINAAWGLGEAVVGGLVTPDMLVVDKEMNRVLSRETADRQVMTVLLGGGTEEQPVPEKKRCASVLSDRETGELLQLGMQIENLYGYPMDIEWARAVNKFAILQARPITALPEAEPPEPREWKLPKGCYVAMRNNIVELMADPLSPLFATLGRSAINATLQRLMEESFGMGGIMPEEIIITVNGYAYNNGSLSPRNLARVLFDSGKIMKKMFTGAVERWTDIGRPRYIQITEDWQARPWREYKSADLLKGVSELFEAALDAYGALISGVIPAAWISEALFTIAYKLLIKRRGDLPAPAYLMGFESIPIRSEKSLFDLAQWTRTIPALGTYLQKTPTSQLVDRLKNDQLPPEGIANEWKAWQDRFQDHLRQYGFTIYNLDFANPVPADDPAPVLETFKLFLSGQGTNPYTRQQAFRERRDQAVQAMPLRLKGLRLRLFNKFLASAQRYAPLREEALAEIGLAYPLLRQMLGELGQRLSRGGVISDPEDIFWLTQEEVEHAAAGIDAGQAVDSLAATIPARKAANRAAMKVSPPTALPQLKLFGRDLRGLKSRRGRAGAGEVIKGVACSPGSVTATARVMHGTGDFGQMRPGDVLVASITTPAWTPLFAMASAIVTDVGGPLSHGSIVAREYGIPAVLGTGVATRRIQNGQLVTVDGTKGKVTLQ